MAASLTCREYCRGRANMVFFFLARARSMSPITPRPQSQVARGALLSLPCLPHLPSPPQDECMFAYQL